MYTNSKFVPPDWSSPLTCILLYTITFSTSLLGCLITSNFNMTKTELTILFSKPVFFITSHPVVASLYFQLIDPKILEHPSYLFVSCHISSRVWHTFTHTFQNIWWVQPFLHLPSIPLLATSSKKPAFLIQIISIASYLLASSISPL